MTRRKPLVLRGGTAERLQVGDLLAFGKLNLGTAVPLIIVASVITISSSYHTLFSATVASLNSIIGGDEGDVLVIRTTSLSADVTIKDNIGNLRLAGNFALNDPSDTMVLLFDGTNWLELLRSNNG